MVEYREIAGYPDYRVGSDGTVWSSKKAGRALSRTIRRDESGWFPMKLSRIRPPTSLTEYVVVGLFRAGRSKKFFVHRLVLEAFIGPCPSGMEACHRDDCGTNNRLENLRWDTSAANKADMARNGNQRRGVRVWSARLTEDDVRMIRLLAAGGSAVADLAKSYGVRRWAIREVILRTTWAHVV